MSKMNEIIKSSDIVTLADAQSCGISKPSFYKYIKQYNFVKIGPGIYAAPDAWVDSLYVLHKRCPQGVISHDEAFYYHGLTDREPVQPTITIYSGYNAKRLTTAGYKVYMVKKELLELGKISVEDNFGNVIPMYDLERTICDLVRNRSAFETQDFYAALKAYAARKVKDLNRLMRYAELFRVDKVVRQYLEVLL